jgi:hypothetical protein
VLPTRTHNGRFLPGTSGNPGGRSKERRALSEAIEGEEVPKVVAMLDALFDRGIRGDNIAAKEQLVMLIQEARRRRDQADSQNQNDGSAP